METAKATTEENKMNILERLNSGTIHAAARKARPECVDANGNIHKTKQRAGFIALRAGLAAIHGDDVSKWPSDAIAKMNRAHV